MTKQCPFLFAVEHLETFKVTCIAGFHSKSQWREGQRFELQNFPNLKYLGNFGRETAHFRWSFFLKHNLIRLIANDYYFDEWSVIFKNSSSLEDLGITLYGDHLRKVIEGRVPNLKSVWFLGDHIDLEKILRLPNIESVVWDPFEKMYGPNNVHNALRENGRKLKNLLISYGNANRKLNSDKFELPMIKAIAENCPNLEYLSLCNFGLPDPETSKYISELPLRQLLQRLQYLELSSKVIDPLELFKRTVQSERQSDWKWVTIERIAHHVMIKTMRGQLMPSIEYVSL